MKLYGRLRMLAPLLSAALRNPRQTVRLLSLERLRNLYITLFRQPPEMQESIVSFYMDMYRPEFQSEGGGYETRLPELPLVFPEPSAEPLVSIVVPVHDHLETTLRCLGTVLRNSAGIDYELIVADDASTDGTRDIAGSLVNARLIVNRENLGFLENCNRAAGTVRGRWLVLLNNDTQVSPGWLGHLLAAAERDPSVGLVGPKLLYPDGRLQEAGGIVWRDGSAWNYGRGADPRRPEFNYLREVDYVSGACLCIRMALWRRLGGFDARFAPAYYEDTDLAFSARGLGYRTLYQPRAEVIHLEGISHGKDERVGIKSYQERNRKAFAAKWREVLAREHLAPGRELPLAREGDKTRKTILVIDHRVPSFDRDAGSRSTHAYLCWFVESGFRVQFIGDSFLRHQPYTEALQDLGVEVLYGPHYARHWRDWLRLNGRYIDYVYLHRPQVARKYLTEVRCHCRGKVLYFGHDLHYLRAERLARFDDRPEALAEAERWRAIEFEVFRHCDVIYFPSPVEVDEVRRHFPAKVVRAIPLYLTDGVAPRADDFAARQGLLLVAGFGHPPNLDACDWFVEEVFPRIRAELPDCRLTVIGSNMPARLREVAVEGVELFTDVSDTDLQRAYSKARLAVVPLRFGAGIKGKILEAMQLQLPVVTTTIGAEGLPEAGSFLTIADRPEDFAGRLVRLYRSPQQWASKREQGRRVFNRHFSKSKAREILGQDIEFADRSTRD